MITEINGATITGCVADQVEKLQSKSYIVALFLRVLTEATHALIEKRNLESAPNMDRLNEVEALNEIAHTILTIANPPDILEEEDEEDYEEEEETNH